MSLLKARLVCEVQNVFSLQIVHIQWEIFAVLNPLGEKKSFKKCKETHSGHWQQRLKRIPLSHGMSFKSPILRNS